jgi:PhoH-like ATPase
MAKKFYVLDTSVYLTDFNSVFSYGNNDIVVPLIVLEELDKLKKRPNGVGLNARGIIRILDGLRERGKFQKVLA